MTYNHRGGMLFMHVLVEGWLLYERKCHEQNGDEEIRHVEDRVMEDGVGHLGPLAHRMVEKLVVVFSLLDVEGCLLPQM